MASHRIPLVDNGHPRLIVITSVARHESEAVMDGCRSDDQIRLREGMPRLPAFLNQKLPLEHDVFGNLENPFAEHGPDLIREPVVEVGAAIGLTDQLNAETIAPHVMSGPLPYPWVTASIVISSYYVKARA